MQTRISVSFPAQEIMSFARPTGFRFGLRHNLVRVCCPTSHVLLQSVQFDHSVHSPCIKQDWWLQCLLWLKFPEHCFPPCCEGGLLQFRYRDFIPSEQVLLHSVQLDHSPHPPSIGHGINWHISVSVALPVQG